MVYWPSIDYLVQAVSAAIDVLELEPQPFWFPPGSASDCYRVDKRALDLLQQLPQPKIVHGVGFPIGGTAVPQGSHLKPFVECITALKAAWASEHLSFNRLRRAEVDMDLGFLLPPIQSPESVALAASNIRTAKAHLPVPFAFETGVNYLPPLEGELSDGSFFASVAEAADCGILLDLHNVWANERNGRQRVLELVAELPLERIWELHIAGGQELDGLWVDAHSGLAPSEVIDLARCIVPTLPNLKAIIVEIMPEYAIDSRLESEDLLQQLWQLREIWDLRGTQVATGNRPHRVGAERVAHPALPTPSQWEESLAVAVTGSPTADPSEWLADSPGVGVLRRLVASVRAGKVTTALPLTTRLLLLTLREEGVQALFESFWRAVPSESTALNEGRGFANYLEENAVDVVPFLHEVMAFELAAHQVVVEKRAQVLHVRYDLRQIVSALREGRVPHDIASGDYDVIVDARSESHYSQEKPRGDGKPNGQTLGGRRWTSSSRLS